MTPTLTLLTTLRQNQIHISLEGDRLRVRGPIDRLTEHLKAELAQHKAQLVETLRHMQSASAILPPLRKTESRGESLALGPYQKRFWFFDQLQPSSARYIRTIQIRVDAPFEPRAYIACLNEFVRRHEILRTIFPSTDGEPRQQVLPHYELDVPIIDLSQRSESDQEASLAGVSLRESREPFDLATRPGIRAGIACLAKERYVLWVTLHHIAYDAWSIAILFREVRALYQAQLSGAPPALPDLPVQYADFTEWQNRALQGAPTDALIARARSHLHDAPPVFVWPQARPRPPIQTYNGATLRMCLPDDVTASVYRLSQDSGHTPFSILMAAFHALLYRHSGQTDFCLGSLSANRNQLEIEPLMGNFVNILALRCRIRSNDTFPDLLRSAHLRMLDARGYQELPFEHLIEQPFVQRHPAYSPIFQVMFTMENENLGGKRGLAGGDWHWQTLPETLEDHSTYARFDLTVTVQEAQRRLELAFEYNVDLLDQAIIDGLMRAYPILLADAMSRPHAKIDDLAMISEQERRRLLIEWNRTGHRHAGPRLLHRRFEEQVAATPERTALTFESTCLTYAELNARANRLAHYLRDEASVSPDSLVAICCDPGVALVVGILGALKAGGAYLPLDPAYPRERLEWMLEDARPVVMLTERGTSTEVASFDLPTLYLDDAADTFERQPATNPVNVVAPAHLAYVIYTSGSTGRPKGSAISHAAAANFICGIVNGLYPDMSPQRALRVGVNASFSFDGSLKQFLLLLFGCSIFPIPAAVRADPERLLAFLAKHEIDVVNCTPSQLRTWLDEAGGEAVCPRIVVGGEAIDPALWRRMQSVTNLAAYNVYGPTECAAVSTWCRIEGDASPPVIGRPLENVQVYILDHRLDPVPIGAIGEIYIGGAGLARGYVGKPSSTAERFLPDPFGETPGMRLYRTGDLARYLADGRIAFIGRTDHQVKVRGHRIELGEVESALQRLAGVSDAIVVTREGAAGDTELAAYVACKPGMRISASELRAGLRRSLPDYMLPSSIVTLERLPLTAHGKVDRHALPAPDIGQTPPTRDDRNTPTQAVLLRLWKETLVSEEIGIHDTFFDVGGHSFRALLLLAAIKRTTGVTLPVSAMFSHPTIAEQAALLDASRPASRTLLVPLAAHPDAPPLFCIHTVGGQVFYYRELALQLHGLFSVFGVQSPEAAGMAARAQSLEELALRYAAEIKAAHPAGPYRLIGWSAGARIALAVAAALEAQGDVVNYLGVVDARLAGRKRPNETNEALLGHSLFALSGGQATAAEVNALARTLNLEEVDDAIAPETNGGEKEDALLGYLRKWNVGAASDMAHVARRELTHIYRHFQMLAPSIAAPPLRTSPHVIWAARSPNRMAAKDFDWSELTTDPPKNVATTIDCDHFNILKPPHVRQLADAITQHVARQRIGTSLAPRS